MTGRTVVIGVGNPYRCDDGVGWVVAEAAGRRLGELVEVRQCDGDSARLLDAWADKGLAVVVDAVHTGSEPGTIRVVGLEEVRVAALSPALGSHALGIAHAVALGRILDQMPQHLVVMGVEAHETGFGEGLTPRVAAAVGPAVHLVDELVRPPIASDQVLSVELAARLAGETIDGVGTLDPGHCADQRAIW